MTRPFQSDTGRAPDHVRAVADAEHIDPADLSRNLADGSVVIMRRNDRYVGIGRNLRIKVNVNIGTSNVHSSPEEEVKKARTAERFGADTLSDLSMCENVREVRSLVFAHTTIPITTVPVYQTAVEIGIEDMTASDILATIREQAREGVSSMVIHTITPEILELCRQNKRTMGIVSKGGSITAAFMLHHNCPNPFLENYQEILEIIREYDIVLSLGNTARCGCIGDVPDPAQQEELRMNIALAGQAHRSGVQVIIEGAGGHVRYDRIGPAVRLYKDASVFPLFVAGPLPTDIALGYDHIAGCAGASAAGAAGADYLCCITPAEHLGLPTPDQIREGIIAWKIAAHIGDLARHGVDDADREMARRRARMDRRGQLELAMDREKVREIAGDGNVCTMCGNFCALRLMERYLKRSR